MKRLGLIFVGLSVVAFAFVHSEHGHVTVNRHRAAVVLLRGGYRAVALSWRPLRLSVTDSRPYIAPADWQAMEKDVAQK